MALLTSTEAKAIKPDLSGSAQDTLIDTLIGRADEVLATWCGYPVYDSSTIPSLTQQTYTQYLDGPTWEDSKVLAVPFFPLGTITSIHDDPTDRTYGAATLVDSSDYDVDTYRGLVILTQSSVQGFWSKGFRAQKIVTQAGWATVPEALKHAGAELVWHWYRLMRERGKQSVSVGGGSTGLRTESIPDHVWALVSPYRLPGSLL